MTNSFILKSAVEQWERKNDLTVLGGVSQKPTNCPKKDSKVVFAQIYPLSGNAGVMLCRGLTRATYILCIEHRED
jgi:hypothetical protein